MITSTNSVQHAGEQCMLLTQGHLGSPTATYGSGDSCFATPIAAGQPATPSFTVNSPPQPPLLSLPLPPQSPPASPDLDFSPAKLFAAPTGFAHEEVSICQTTGKHAFVRFAIYYVSITHLNLHKTCSLHNHSLWLAQPARLLKHDLQAGP